MLYLSLFYVFTWNVKTYISHPLKCRMCQNWLKWCSDTPPPPPPLNSTWLFGLRKFSCQRLRWWCWRGSVWHHHHHHLKLWQEKFVKFSKSKKSSWSLGVGWGGLVSRHPPHHHHLKLWQEKFLKFSKSKKSSWSLGEVEKNFFSGFIHFMKFLAFLVKEWKNYFSVFIHFMKFPAFLVQV